MQLNLTLILAHTEKTNCLQGEFAIFNTLLLIWVNSGVIDIMVILVYGVFLFPSLQNVFFIQNDNGFSGNKALKMN